MIAAAAGAGRWWDVGRRKALAHQFSHYHRHILSLYVGKLGDLFRCYEDRVYLGFPLSSLYYYPPTACCHGDSRGTSIHARSQVYYFKPPVYLECILIKSSPNHCSSDHCPNSSRRR